MRTTVLLLALAVVAVVVLAACQTRDDAAADSTAADSTESDDSGNVAEAPTSEAASRVAPQAQTDRPRGTSKIRGAADSTADTALPPQDTARALRPDMPQVTPPKRPRTWRGFKLPEEMPVRAPVETIKRVEQVPDSMMKGDSIRPPRPDR
jgi:hypothetical protein